MAYSFARSGRESYGNKRDRSPNRRVGDSMSDSQIDSGPEYLDLGFAWLNDYDKAGNYRPSEKHANALTETRQENPYGWNALGPTRRVPLQSSEVSGFRQSSGEDPRSGAVELTETRRQDLRHTSRDDLRQASGGDFGRTNRSDIRFTSSGHIRRTNRSDIRQTDSSDFRQSERNDLVNTTRNDIRQINRNDLSNTRDSNLRTTVQPENLLETQKKNPFGWKALGPTRRVPSFTTETEDVAQATNPRTTTNFEDSVKENPYGWKALGQTRHQSSSHNSDTESTARKSRKRTHQTSFSRRSSRANREEQSNVISNEVRKIKHAKRLSALPEEIVRNGGIMGDGVMQTTTVDGGLRSKTGGGILRDTTGGRDLRGTTYDYPYARNTLQETSLEHSTRQPVSTRMPENRLRKWAIAHTPEDSSKLWTDIATDQSLMRKWYELFAKIKRRWAVNYKDPSLMPRLSEDTGFKPAAIMTRSLNKRRQLSGRRKLALICAVVFIVMLVAIVVPVSILTANVPEKEAPTPEDVLWEYRLQATIINRLFNEDMANISTEAFRNISQPFCDQIDENGFNSPFNYIGCVVTSLSNGSVVVNFSVVINASKENPPDKIKVQAAIGLNSTEQIPLGQFALSGNVTILRRLSIQSGNNPIPEEKDFNMNCTDADLCKTNFSLCIYGICSCPYYRYHEASHDTCLPISCGEIPEVANGISRASGKFYGSVLTIECDIGYEMSGNSSLLCTSKDSWKTPPKCDIIQCEDFMISDHVVIVAENSQNRTFQDENSQNRTFQDEIIVSCEQGFEITGENKTTCLANKTWSNIPVCKPVNCSEPDLPENVSKLSENNSYAFESAIELMCSKGYVLEGEGNISCQANKTWTEFPTCSAVTCPTFQFPQNAVEQENVTGKVFQEEIVIKCSTGYDVIGNDTVECLEDGIWSESPNCTIIDCGDLEDPVNGVIKSDEGTKFNMTQTVSCNEGFKLKDGGTDVVTCTRYGNWSELPTCKPVECGQPNEIEHGNYLNENETTITFNSTISVECLNGYELNGNATIVCESTGNWTSSPKCIPINCSLTNVSDNFNTSDLQDNNYSVNSSVILECNSGFIMQGNGTIVCQSNGSWTVIPDCTPVVCPLFDKPNNSIIVGFNESAQYQYSEIVTIECDIGYNISSNENVTCKDDGNWTKIPGCLKVQCNSYELENGQTGNQTFYSEVLEIECDFGYELSNNNPVNCSENGQWSSNPTCELVDCEEFSLPEHASVVNDENSTLINTTLEVSCEPGYALINKNEAYVTCEADGNWTGHPECEIIPALFFTEPAATVQIGDTVQLQCVLVGNFSSLDVNISRNSIILGEQHLCDASQTGPVNCSFSLSKDGDSMTATVLLDYVECEDEGTYYCESVSNSSLQAAMNMSVTKPADGKPLLTLPVRMVNDLSEQSQTISCAADVGYPAGDLRIEYSTENSTSFNTFELGTEGNEINRNGCSVNKTITFSNYTFTESLNNTNIRCAVYNGTEDTIPNQVSDIGKIELIANECPSTDIEYQYHPLNCHYFIFCNSGNIEVIDCGETCPDIRNSTTPPNCNGNCTSLGC